MGKGRNDMGVEWGALITAAASLGLAAIGGGAKLANQMHIDSKISDNEAKRKELSKGLGWLTNSDEISKLNEENAKLRAKKK